jgi:hypothetical protein
MSCLPACLPACLLTCPQERVAFWRGLGFSQAELTLMLDRMPRLLLYPMHAPKYQLKLAFLTGPLLRLFPLLHPVRFSEACMHACAAHIGGSVLLPRRGTPERQGG